MACFGSEVYYKVKQQRRAISEAEQKMVRLSFTEMGCDDTAIEFDRNEEQYPALMRLARYKLVSALATLDVLRQFLNSFLEKDT